MGQEEHDDCGLAVGSTQFTGHSRAHQYMVNSKESHGGVTLTVDRDAWDAPVAIIG